MTVDHIPAWLVPCDHQGRELCEDRVLCTIDTKSRCMFTQIPDSLKWIIYKPGTACCAIAFDSRHDGRPITSFNFNPVVVNEGDTFRLNITITP